MASAPARAYDPVLPPDLRALSLGALFSHVLMRDGALSEVHVHQQVR